MKYRKFGKLGIEMSALGFGCMRLPLMAEDYGIINEPEAIRMIRYAVDNGVNYVDTAYPYHKGQSERLVAKALKDGYRDKVYLATKFPSWMLKEPSDFDRILDEQLQKLETDHIDFYLLHALNNSSWDTMVNNNVFEAIERFQKSGKVKHIGFSFHDDLAAFKRIIDAYAWDFCQIQFNYLDEYNQAGLEGLEYAAARGIAVVVMEPLLGGKLAIRPPEPVARLWEQATVQRAPAEWALRWVWNHPGVSVVLSGMSTFDQVEENLKIADAALAQSLTAEELSIVAQVISTYKNMPKIDCTACEYCMPCPFGVSIPGNFRLLNGLTMYNDMNQKKAYARLEENAQAANCRACGKCESKCPQKLPIRELMKTVAKFMAE
jgi:uncharacterized protein